MSIQEMTATLKLIVRGRNLCPTGWHEFDAVKTAYNYGYVDNVNSTPNKQGFGSYPLTAEGLLLLEVKP